jgi:hypothetical protein
MRVELKSFANLRNHILPFIILGGFVMSDVLQTPAGLFTVSFYFIFYTSYNL